MNADVGTIDVSINKKRDDSKSVVRSLDSIEKSVDSATNKLNNFSGTVSRSFAKVAGAVLSMRALGKAINGGIKDLDNLARTTSLMNNVFGDGAGEVLGYAKEVERLMGIPASEFLSTQGTFANMLTGFGIASDKVKTMSQNLTQLTYDLEAYNSAGYTQTQIQSMLISGLTGYDRSLRKLGYVVQDTALQEILHANGYDYKISQLDRATKAQLAYISIMEQSAKNGVFGALSRQTMSPVVAFGILKNQIRLVAQTLASVLIPVIMAVMPYLQALAIAIGRVITFVAGLFGLKPAKLDFGISKQSNAGIFEMADGLGEIGNGAKGATKRVKELKHQLGGFDKLNVMKQDTPSSPGGGGAGIPDMPIGGLDLDMPDYGDFLGDMTNRAEELAGPMTALIGIFAGLWAGMKAFKFAKFIAGFGGIGKIFESGGLLSKIGAFGGAVIQLLMAPFKVIGNLIMSSPLGGLISTGLGLIRSIFTDFGLFVVNTFSNLGAWVVDKFFGIFGPAIDMLSPVFAKVGAIFAPLTEAIGGVVSAVNPIVWVVGIVMALVGALVQLWATNEEFKNSVLEAWEGISGIISNFWTNIGEPIFTSIKEALISIWTDSIKPLWDQWVEFVRVVATALLDLWNTHLEPFVNWFIETFGPVITNIVDVVVGVFKLSFNIISGVLQGFLGVAGSIVSGIINVFSGIITFLTGVFTGDWSKAWDGVKQIFSSFGDMLYGIWQSVWGAVTGLMSKGGEIFMGIVGSIARVFTSLVNTIIRGINTVIAVPFNLINSALGRLRETKILGLSPFGWLPNIGVPAIPEIPAYERGTNFVPETGVSLLHKGEMVVPEKVAKQGSPFKGGSTSDDDKTEKLLEELIVLTKKLVEKPTNVKVSATDVESGTGKYNRLVTKAMG